MDMVECETLEGNSAKKIKIDNDATENIEKEKEKEKKDIIDDARERQVFNPLNREFDYSKRRVTDLSENNKVYLPKLCDVKEESEIEMMRGIIMGEYREYKRNIIDKKKIRRELRELNGEIKSMKT